MSPAALVTPQSGQAGPPPGFRPTKDREDRSLGEASVYPGRCPWREELLQESAGVKNTGACRASSGPLSTI